MADLLTPLRGDPVPPPGLTEPRLWIRRFAIFDQPGSLLRDVALRPGMNIVWTPDSAHGDEGALGHGSGKTMFCRLLRACLGEDNYATDTQKKAIRARFPRGFVGAEMRIDGTSWVVLRHFARPGEDIAVVAETIEEAVERGKREGDPARIDGAISQAFLAEVMPTAPSAVAPEHVWDVVRAWLTRDQESRLRNILDWRSTASQSGSIAQELSAASKLATLRLTLRALDAEETAAQERLKELLARRETVRNDAAYTKRRQEETRAEVRKALEVDEEQDDATLIPRAEAAYREAMRAQRPITDDAPKERARYDSLTEEIEERDAGIAKLNTEIALTELKAQQARSEASKGAITKNRGTVRYCPICDVPLDRIRAEGCKISLETVDLEKLSAEIEAKENEAVQLEGEVARHKADRDEAVALNKQRREERDKLKDDLSSLETTAKKTRNEDQERISRAYLILQKARALSEDEPSDPQAQLDAKIEQTKEERDNGRARGQRALSALSSSYEGLVGKLFPEGMEGRLTLDGNGLKTTVGFAGRGDVETAALDSWRIVAFDLAVLHMAIEGKAHLPPFLLHDSPREADLDQRLYDRLFHLLGGWERAGKSPCFQYIVTTTTAPPDTVRNDPAVILEMRSTPAEKRLFGLDLG